MHFKGHMTQEQHFFVVEDKGKCHPFYFCCCQWKKKKKFCKDTN